MWLSMVVHGCRAAFCEVVSTPTWWRFLRQTANDLAQWAVQQNFGTWTAAAWFEPWKGTQIRSTVIRSHQCVVSGVRYHMRRLTDSETQKYLDEKHVSKAPNKVPVRWCPQPLLFDTVVPFLRGLRGDTTSDISILKQANMLRRFLLVWTIHVFVHSSGPMEDSTAQKQPADKRTIQFAGCEPCLVRQLRL